MIPKPHSEWGIKCCQRKTLSQRDRQSRGLKVSDRRSTGLAPLSVCVVGWGQEEGSVALRGTWGLNLGAECGSLCQWDQGQAQGASHWKVPSPAWRLPKSPHFNESKLINLTLCHNTNMAPSSLTSALSTTQPTPCIPPPCSRHPGLLSIPQENQGHSLPRGFELAIPSARNSLFPDPFHSQVLFIFHFSSFFKKKFTYLFILLKCHCANLCYIA